MTTNILIVDDEPAFLNTLAEGIKAFSPEFSVYVADNGMVAKELLETLEINLLITDIVMPEMDGFELIALASSRYPSMPVIVISGSGSKTEEQRAFDLGAVQFIRKPVSLNSILEKVTDALISGAQGHMQGITLPSFIQIVEMERKTCVVIAGRNGNQGRLWFVRGELVHAQFRRLSGLDAAYSILALDRPEIRVSASVWRDEPTISMPTQHVIMEAFRLKDEADRTNSAGGEGTTDFTPAYTPSPNEGPTEEDFAMGIKDKLQELSGLDSFKGAALFTPKGEPLGVVEASGGGFNIKEVGLLANQVLMNAQKACLEMGAGRGQFVHVVGEKAHIFARCVNEGSNPIESEPGKAHIHAVLILGDDSAVGLAKMKLNKVAESLCDDCRS